MNQPAAAPEVIDLRVAWVQLWQWVWRYRLLLGAGLLLGVGLAGWRMATAPLRWSGQALLITRAMKSDHLALAINDLGRRLPATSLHPQVVGLSADRARLDDVEYQVPMFLQTYGARVTVTLADTAGAATVGARLVAELERGPYLAERRVRGADTVQLVYALEHLEGPQRPLVAALSLALAVLGAALLIALGLEAYRQGRARLDA